MKRVTVELLLTDDQVESARVQSARIGKPGTFDVQGLLSAGFVSLDDAAVTIRAVEPVPGPFGIESWPGLEPTVVEVRTTWYDTAQERERQARDALREFRSVRYVTRSGAAPVQAHKLVNDLGQTPVETIGWRWTWRERELRDPDGWIDARDEPECRTKIAGRDGGRYQHQLRGPWTDGGTIR